MYDFLSTLELAKIRSCSKKEQGSITITRLIDNAAITMEYDG
jgi:hypothetical protein